MSAGDRPGQRRPAVGRAAIAGLLSAGLALGVAELVAGALSVSSLAVAVGESVITAAPPAVTDLAIEVIGGLQRGALVTGTLVVLTVLGAAIGVLALRSPLAAGLAIVTLGTVGGAAAITSTPDPLPGALGPAVAAVLAGLGALRLTVPLARRAAPASTPQPGSGASEDAARRDFLRLAGTLTVAVAVTAAGGRWLQQRAEAARERLAVSLPAADAPAPPLPDGTDLGLDGLSSFVTPNDEFYRIDTALRAPRVVAEDWRLRVHGLVDHEMELGYEDLLTRDLVEADVTLLCVSNEVGGDLVGNARWLGVRLDEVLRDVGVRPEATQLVGRSVDGYTGGFPVADALDGRDALLAIGMNGEPLPIEHGYPVRLVVPGLYGYVSAVKWLAELELTTFEEFDQYWVRRGWAERAPVKTQSRIDRPGDGSEVPSGRVVIAGVAWAQTRGIEAVEIQVDEDEWTPAELAAVPGPDTWRQWRLAWDASPGTHRVRVRATDAEGRTQSGDPTDPVPDGAEGWHTIEVRVTA